jgi:hypothetical protein
MTEGERTGSPFGDEARRFLAGVQDWARRTLPPPEEHSATCQWCPLCSFVAVLRGERPDLTERVAEAGTAVATAFRALLEPPAAGESRERAEPAGPEDEPA